MHLKLWEILHSPRFKIFVSNAIPLFQFKFLFFYYRLHVFHDYATIKFFSDFDDSNIKKNYVEGISTND